MLGVFIHPAFAGPPLAVLFVMTVLRLDELRRQGNDLGASWAHDHQGNGALIVAGVAC